jgi:hypothetical protein
MPKGWFIESNSGAAMHLKIFPVGERDVDSAAIAGTDTRQQKPRAADAAAGTIHRVGDNEPCGFT